MKKSTKFGEIFSKAFGNVQHEILDRIISGDRVEEDHITSTLFTLLEEEFKKYSDSGYTIRANQFQGRGRNSSESLYGADGALILNARLPEVEFTKIVLLQAKKSTKKPFVIDEDAIKQKNNMLSITADSFFVVYEKARVRVYSAFSIGDGLRVDDLPSKPLDDFLEDFFNCFIGDNKFHYPQTLMNRLWGFGPWPPWYRDFARLIEEVPIAKDYLSVYIENQE